MTTEEKSKKVEEFITKWMYDFGGQYDLLPDAQVIAYIDNCHGELQLRTYDEFLQSMEEVYDDECE